MDYDNMSDTAIKVLLLEIMEQRESAAYVMGWLRQSYCYPTTPDIERTVAIKQLKKYGWV